LDEFQASERYNRVVRI